MIPNPNSMLAWWPALQGTSGLLLPRTELVLLPRVFEDAEELLYWCVQHGTNCAEERRNRWDIAGHARLLPTFAPLVREACARLGYPAFLRTDLMSGKHGWLDTCFVASPEMVPSHLVNLVEDQAMKTWMTPGAGVGAFVVRELLDPEAPFTAWNGLPIGREFRYFVEDGHAVCRHAYWDDAENIERGLHGQAPAGWREALHELSALDPVTDNLLTFMAEQAGRALPGAWSVDFMLAQRRRDPLPRWWLIDCALAADSWHPEHAS